MLPSLLGTLTTGEWLVERFVELREAAASRPSAGSAGGR